jgi:hypothetical protein
MRRRYLVERNSEHTSSKTKIKSYVAELPTLISMIAAVSISLAVARQLGVFVVLDTKLLASLSVDDILRNSLTAIPITLFFWGIGILLSESDHARKIIQTQPTGKIGNFVHSILRIHNPGKEIKLSMWMFLFLAVFVASWPFYMFFQLSILYMSVLTWVYTRESKLSKLPPDLYYAGFLVVSAFLSGAMQGQLLLTTKLNSYAIETLSGQTRLGNLVSITSTDFVFIDEAKQILVIPRQQVASLVTRQLPPPEPSVDVYKRLEWLKNWFR